LKKSKKTGRNKKIKKRFGGTAEEIEAYHTKSEEEFKRLSKADERAAGLSVILDREKTALIKASKALDQSRKSAARGFERDVVENLAGLGMAGSLFKAEIVFPETEEGIMATLTERGADSVKFLISPNKGEPLRPLAKIASGGEMSRFMLGLKNITASIEGIETLVFDEIDVGISGKIARAVAEKLYDVARERQVLAVTHLPQLASMADTHYLISKGETAGKTLTNVKCLNREESLKEIMRLSGSADGSEAGYINAAEMKKRGGNI